MARNALLPVLFMFLIDFNSYNVCFGWELRKLLGGNPKDKNTTEIVDPRPPGPIIGDNKSDPKPVGETGKEKMNPQATNSSTLPVPIAKVDNEIVNTNGSNNASSAGAPRVTKGDVENVNKNTEGKGDKEKSTEQENKKKNEEKGDQENKKNNEGKGDPEKNPDPEKNKNNEGKGDPEKNSAQENKNNEGKGDPGKSHEQENKNNAGKGDDGNSTGKENKKNSEGKIFTHSTTSENCGLTHCSDQGKMVACIFKSGPKDLVVLVQNGGDNTIKVKLQMESILGDLLVAKNQTEKINIPLPTGGSTTLTLNAGTGDCVLHMGTPVPEGKSYLHLPSLDRLLTPVNGAYFLILTVLVFGGTCACCKLRRKKRHDSGVPYQELEMALPQSVSATDMETAEGWDQGWDDDWDEDTAVKSPGKPHVGSISANGLTSRTSNRDGWEDSWHD